MAARLFSPDGAARATAEPNPPAVDTFRRRIFPPPYGSLRRIAARLGRPEKWVYPQSRGEDPLTLALTLEVLSEHPVATVESATAELLAPLGLLVLRLPEPGQPGSVLAAHSQVLQGMSVLEAELASALADSKIDPREAARLGAICGELRARVAALDAQISGGGK